VRKSGSDQLLFDSQHYLTAIKSEPETVMLNNKSNNKMSKLLAGDTPEKEEKHQRDSNKIVESQSGKH